MLSHGTVINALRDEASRLDSEFRARDMVLIGGILSASLERVAQSIEDDGNKSALPQLKENQR
jgi:hypothetical protein